MTRIKTEDVVERLRSWPAITQGDALSASTVALLMEGAADTIERLREENARYCGALEKLESQADETAGEAWVARIARAALTPSVDET